MTSDGLDSLAAMRGRPWFMANELLAFVIELAALACLSWWGFTAGGGAAARWLLGLGIPAVAIVLWGLFAAPRARVRLPLWGVLLVKAVVLGGGVYAVYRVGHPVAAAVAGVVVVVNTGLAEFFRRLPAR
ncbi:YrdB family protein [Streptomyces sp. NPDC051020]|uniref:YrdB family protein n=1 Tax=Streptomyces sp. NPDC051020 TaxID=3155409 RepID=UPI0034329D96